MEDKPTPVGCELENLDEEIMQGDEHSLDMCLPLCHNYGCYVMNKKLNPTLIIEDIHE